MTRKTTPPACSPFFDMAADMLCLMDAECTILRVNQAFTAGTGWSANELTGQPFKTLVHDDDQRHLATALRGGAKGSSQRTFQIRWQFADGDYRWLQWLFDKQDGHFYGRVHSIQSNQKPSAARGETTTIENDLHLRAFNAAANGVAITDPRGNVQWVNKAFTRLTGYQAAEVIGQSISILKSGQQPDSFYEEMWRTITVGNIWRGEVINRRKDGSFYNEEMTITPVRNDKGEIANFIAIKQNINDRITTEKEIREERERMRTILKAVTTPLLISRITNGNIVYANQELANLLDVSLEELNTWTIANFCANNDDRQFVVNEVQTKGSLSNYELRLKRSDGSDIWVMLSARLMQFEGEPAIITTLIDITGRRQADETMRRLAYTVEQSLDGTAVANLDGIVTFANPAWARMHGYEVDELIGQHLSIFHTPEQLENEVTPANAQVMETGEGFQGEIGHVRQDGSIFPTMMSISLLRDEEGQPIGFSAACQDITERKAVENELREAQARTETILESVTIPLLISRVSDGYMQYVNQHIADLVDVPLAELRASGATPNFYANPDDRKFILSELKTKGYLRNHELLIKRPDDSTFWSLLSARLIQFEGEPAIITTLIDITDRKEAENEIREAQQRTQTILESVTVPLLISRVSDGYMEYVNQELANLLGMPLEELRTSGTTPDFYADPNDRQFIINELQTKRYLQNHELRLKRADGSVFWSLLTSRLIQFEGKPAIFTTVIDTTAIKEAEEEIREAQERTQTILESVTIPLLITRVSDGKMQYVNQHTADLVDIPLETLRATGAAPDFYGNPADRNFVLSELQTKGYLRNHELLIKRPDGSTFWSLLSARLIKFEGDMSVITTMIDITERRQAEETLHKQASELQTVAEVSTKAATALDEHDLLQEVVDLAKVRFNLYHVHIYLLDEAGEDLVLAAGAGDVGRQMVASGHAIPFDREQSLVARAARTRAGVIVNDVQADPGFLPNTLLPDTRAEMAVPMVVGNRVLGVLDVQANIIDRFTDQDVQIQTTLAAQAAVALQNARQYQQMQAEQALLQTVLANIPAGVFVVEAPTGRPLLANESAQRMLGRGISPEATTENINEIYEAYRFGTDELYPPTEMPVTLSIMGESTHIDDMEVRKPDGTRVLLEVDGTPIYTDAGDLTSGVVVFQDITERRQAEEAMRRLTYAVEQSLDGTAVADLDGIVTFANPAWARMHGYEVDELIGQHLSIFHTPEQLENEVAPANAQVMETGEGFQGEIGHVRKDGSTFPTMMSISLLRDEEGQPIGLSAACQDITERQAAEAANRKRASELQTVSEIATTITNIRDSQELLEVVVQMTQRQFDLYHCHVFIMDDLGENLRVRACGWRAGEEHPGAHDDTTIPLVAEKSLVAQAARHREAVVVNDTTSDPNWLPNELLPNTRSEMAIPLVIGERVLGVLDVQATSVDHFTEEDVRINATLASQIAVALENARSFELSQKALADLNSLTRRLTREGWEEFVATSEQAQTYYGYDLSTILTDEETAVVSDGIATALQVQGEEIGQLIVSEPQTQDAEVNELINAIAEQLSAHLENIRLTEQTQQALATTEQQKVRLQLINKIVSAVSTTTDLQEAMEFVAKELVRATGVDTCGIALLTKDGRHLQVIADYRSDPEYPAGLGMVFPVTGNPSSEQVISTRQTLVIDDPQTNPITKPIHPQMRERGMEKLVIIPMIAGNEVIGTVGLDLCSKGTELSDDKIQLAETIVLQSTVAANNIRLFEQTQQALAETATLYEAGAKLNAAQSYEDLLAVIQRYTTAGQQAQQLAIDLFSQPWSSSYKPEWFEVLAYTTKRDEKLSTSRFMIEDYPEVGDLIRADQPTIITNISTDERISEKTRLLYTKGFGATTVIYIPLTVGGQWLGFINALYKDEATFTDDEIRQFMAVASQVAVSMQTLRLLDETSRLYEQEQARARREQALREITAKVRNTTDVDAVLRTAVKEIGRVLNRKTAIYLEKANGKNSTRQNGVNIKDN